jgi:tetratricopeptide (TPR) repeat protein
MANKLNKKFLTVISIFAFVSLAVVGGIAYLQVSGAPERNRSLGDAAMAAAEAALAAGDAKEAKKQFTEAMSRYGRAVSKRPNNVQYIDLMRGALERIVPDTGSEANELYERWLSVLQQRVRAKPEDGEARMAFISVVRSRAELVGTPEAWKSVCNVCDDALAALPPSDPFVKAIRRTRAEAEVRRDSVLTTDERAEAERQLREIVAADPADGAAWGALISSINADATRLQRAGRQSDAQRRRTELDDAIAKAQASAGTSPEVILATYDRLLALRALGDPSVTPSQLVEMGEPLVASAGQLTGGQILDVAERIAATGDETLIRQMVETLREYCAKDPQALIHLRMIAILQFGFDREAARATLESLASRPQMAVSLLGAYQDELRAFAAERLGDLAFIEWEEATDAAARTAALEKLKANRARLSEMVGERGGESALARMDAKIAFAMRDWAEASAKIDQVMATQPVMPPEFYMIAAQVLINRGELGTALTRIDRGLEAFPGSIPMLAVRGEILARLGRTADARRTVEAILAVDPTSPAARELIKVIDAVAASAAGGQAVADPVVSVLGRSEALYVAGKYDEALAMVDEALAASPDDVRLRRAKVQVLISLSRPDEAKALVEDSLRLAPDDEGLIRLRAIAAGGSALDRVERVIADLPADPKTRASRRLLLLSQLRDSTRVGIARTAPDARGAAEAELARIEAALVDARSALAQMSPDDPLIFELAFNEALATGDMAAAQTVAANAESSCSDRSLGAVMRGRLAMERNDWTAAVAEFDRARSALGAPAATWRMLGMARERAGDIPGAIEAYAEAYQRQPSDTANVRMYGTLLARTGDPTRALSILRSAAAANPDDAALMNGWLELESQFGDRAGALERRRRIWRDRPSDRENARRLATLLLEVEPTMSMIVDDSGKPRYSAEQFAALPADRQRDELTNVRMQNTEQGMAIARQLMSLDPKDRDTPMAIAMVLRRAGDDIAGAKVLRESISANAGPDEWVRWTDLGTYLVESNALEAAEEAFSRARSMQPAQGMPANRIEGQFWFSRGEWARAKAALDPVFAATPTPELARNLVETMVKMGELQAARETLAKVDASARTSQREQFTDLMLEAVIAEGLAERAYASGDTAAGDAESQLLANALDRAIALEPSDSRPWIVRSNASHTRYQRTGDAAALAQARTEADRAFELQPTLWPVIRQRCIVMVDQNDLRGAIDTIRKFVSAFPRSFDGRRALMTYLAVSGDASSALQVAEDAIRIEPRNRDWYEMLASGQSSLGKPLDAARTYERAFTAIGDADLLTRAVAIRQSVSPPDTAGILAALTAAPRAATQGGFLRLAQAAAAAAEAKTRVSREQALVTLRELRTVAAPSIGQNADRVWVDCARTAFPGDKPAELERFAFDTFAGSPPTPVIAAVTEAYAATGPAGSEKAQSLAKMAIDAAKDPAMKAAALVLQGRVLYQYGKPAESAKALAEAVTLAPNDATALNNLAYLQVTELNQLEDAVRNARRASEITPGSPDILDTLGLALTRSGEHAEAVVVLSRAASIQSSNAVLLHLAEAQAAKGDSSAARQCIERVKGGRPTPEESAQADKLLSRINSPAGS